MVLINGSSHEKGCTYTALYQVAQGLIVNDVDAEIIHIGTHDIPAAKPASLVES